MIFKNVRNIGSFSSTNLEDTQIFQNELPKYLTVRRNKITIQTCYQYIYFFFNLVTTSFDMFIILIFVQMIICCNCFV